MIHDIQQVLIYFGPSNYNQIKTRLAMRGKPVNDRLLTDTLQLLLKQNAIVLADGFEEITYKTYGVSK